MDVVGELLRSSLLTELGDDQERVDRVRAAVAAMATDLVGRNRPLVPSTVIAAFDERTAVDTTILDDAANYLLEVWETFRIAFPAPPVEILRAVAFAALVEAAEHDEAVMQAAWYTARTAVELVPAGRWAVTISGAVDRWRTPVDSAIAAHWIPAAAAATLRMPNLQPTTDRAITVKTDLRDRAGKVAESGNWQTFSQQLMGQFEQIVTDLIAIPESLAAESQRRAVAEVKEFAGALGAKLREAIGAQDQAVQAIELRSALLWWRQSRFSERLSVRYDELAGPADIVIAAAHDLHRMVPPLAPISVEHLLADLVASVADGPAKMRLLDLAPSAEIAVLPDNPHGATPATLVDALAHAGTTTSLLDENTEITPARAAVLVFRDLQARRLAAAPSEEEPA